MKSLPLGEGGSAWPRRMRGGTKSMLFSPHTRQGFALPPSPGRGYYPDAKNGIREFFSKVKHKAPFLRLYK